MSYQERRLSRMTEHYTTEEQAHASVLSGAAAAAIMASAIGCAAVGFFVILADASEAAKEWMTISSAVGPLSGKTTFAVVVWLISWGLLNVLGGGTQVRLSRPYMAVFVVFVVIGGEGPFPPFYVPFAEMFY